MYQSDKYYKCMCIHCNYISMCMRYTHTLVCNYVRVQFKKIIKKVNQIH